MNDTLYGLLCLMGYEAIDWTFPEYNRYYWIGYGYLNRN